MKSSVAVGERSGAARADADRLMMMMMRTTHRQRAAEPIERRDERRGRGDERSGDEAAECSQRARALGIALIISYTTPDHTSASRQDAH